MNKTILLDMDDTLFDFAGGIIALYHERYPEEPFVAHADIYDYHFSQVYREQYGKEAGDRIESLFHTQGLYRNLKPLPGAVEAVHEMLDEGLDVRICTAPLKKFRHCVLEKFESLDEHFGRNLTDQIVLARDKTAIKGDFLVDDKPYITGRYTPEWTQLFYDQPYNRTIAFPRIIDWKEWKSAFEDTNRLS